MNLHEYQAKDILKRYGLPIPAYGVASKRADVEKIIQQHHLREGVVKIQVHAGGRGKAGGVVFCNSPEEILHAAQKLIGMKIVNVQTGPEGVVAHKVIVTQPVSIAKEYYLSVVIDRGRGEPILIASPEGGMEIEEVAAKHPDKILKLPIELDGRLRGYRIVRLCKFMGWKGAQAEEGAKIAKGLARCFIETDASLVEINPLVASEDGSLWAVDAKISVDDNALYRQPEIHGCFDPSQVDKNEVLAKEFDLAYIALDGNIGCMVNGAGLAMATMDLIQQYGGKPANFLDVGGSASKEKVAAGFNIILSDPQVKAVLVNIFGGIMNCATLAEGILAAVEENGIKVPLIVRLEGTNVDEGKALLARSGVSIIPVDSLAAAAEKVVEVLKER